MSQFERGPQKESDQEKRERLRLIFQASLEIFLSEESLEKGMVEVTRRKGNGSIEVIQQLVVRGISEGGVELCGINGEGDPTNSATMFWEEIIDVSKK
ncbi:MAG: hypothetical protein HZB99_00415 [Candidatus Harrisonbacteria bacterium]|nr:hypothetical protein [Candidatus Harrisonbacteria bacterium]